MGIHARSCAPKKRTSTKPAALVVIAFAGQYGNPEENIIRKNVILKQVNIIILYKPFNFAHNKICGLEQTSTNQEFFFVFAF